MGKSKKPSDKEVIGKLIDDLELVVESEVAVEPSAKRLLRNQRRRKPLMPTLEHLQERVLPHQPTINEDFTLADDRTEVIAPQTKDESTPGAVLDGIQLEFEGSWVVSNQGRIDLTTDYFFELHGQNPYQENFLPITNANSGDISSSAPDVRLQTLDNSRIAKRSADGKRWVSEPVVTDAAEDKLLAISSEPLESRSVSLANWTTTAEIPSWTDSLNWSCDAIPNIADHVVISDSLIYVGWNVTTIDAGCRLSEGSPEEVGPRLILENDRGKLLDALFAGLSSDPEAKRSEIASINHDFKSILLEHYKDAIMYVLDKTPNTTYEEKKEFCKSINADMKSYGYALKGKTGRPAFLYANTGNDPSVGCFRIQFDNEKGTKVCSLETTDLNILKQSFNLMVDDTNKRSWGKWVKKVKDGSGVDTKRSLS